MNASEEELAKFDKLIPVERQAPAFKSFKEGIQSIHRAGDVRPDEVFAGAAPVSNPERYRKNAEDAVAEALVDNRMRRNFVNFTITRESSSNKPAREFLQQQYNGCCQVTGRTFTERTGENYFEALSLVPRLEAEYLNDAGNMLCLCADVAAQFMYAEFEWLDSVEEKILHFKAEIEGGTESMRQVSAKVAGSVLTITWSERHFMRLCALWNAA